MARIELNKRRIALLLGAVVILLLLLQGLRLGGDSFRDATAYIPGLAHKQPASAADPDEIWDLDPEPPSGPGPGDHRLPHPPPSSPPSSPPVEHFDLHPIVGLMQAADAQWRMYETDVSSTFRQTVEKYRSRYGRHPPPGFKNWYKFARKRNVYNIDDFDQIMDDLRPFWAVNATDIRTRAAHMWEDFGFGVAVIHIRNHRVIRVDNPSWRSETMQTVIEKFIEFLPDMDIPINRLDQPRVVVPFEDLQQLLDTEYRSRAMPPEVIDAFTRQQPHLLNMSILNKEEDMSVRLDDGWFFAAGKQYMDIAAKACPPGSPARANTSTAEADKLYKESTAGIVTNFNLSSDLCTVGPTIQNLHGMLYSATSIIASHKLVPVFGECKVNVNNDILFPANMYYRHDDRYDYNPDGDLDWRDKQDTLIWRGVTSGGTQTPHNWETMHRQRLVRLFNGTRLWRSATEVKILAEERQQLDRVNTTYRVYDHFQPSQFADRHSDVGFVESWGCIPNCSFYDSVFAWKPSVSLTSQFQSKYLIDVDGHSFSGRWHAFLQSKSLGFKATIFREWHDSRLLAWRHFVPVDNRYDDLYALLLYFIGYGKADGGHAADQDELNPQVFIAPHAKEAQKLARQGREWANKVLRREDIEVYTFRLLLEYGRITDDNRDRIGYSGDGSELDKFDSGEDAGARWGFGGWNS